MHACVPAFLLLCLVGFSFQQCTPPSAVVVYNASTSPKALATNRIKIGVTGFYAFTSFGLGTPVSVMRFAASMYNNNPDILNDTAIELYISANRAPGADSQQGLLSSLYLGSQNMSGFIGGISTQEARVIQQAAQIYNVPQISIHAQGVSLSNKYDYPTFLRTLPSEAGVITSIVALFPYFNWTRAAILYSTNDFGAGYTSLLIAGAAQGIDFVAFPINATGVTEADYLSQMSDFANYTRKQSIKIFVLYLTAINTAWAVKIGDSLGLVGDEFVWILSVNSAGAYTQNVGTTSTSLPFDPKPYLKGSIGITLKNPTGSYFDGLLSQYIANAPANGYTPYSLGNLYYFNFIDVISCYALAYENLMQQGIPFNQITKPMLLNALFKLKFDGVAGPVEFDANGDRIGFFSIMTFFGNNSYIPVAQYSFLTNSIIQTGEFIFHDNSSNVPSDGREQLTPSSPDGYRCFYNAAMDIVCERIYLPREYSRALAGGLAAIVGVGVLVGLFATVMLIMYHDVFFQKHGTFYCVVVLSGVFLAFAGALTLLPERSDNLCLAFPWLIGVAFTFVYGCLFIKAWILYRIWRYAMQLKKMAITALTVVKYVGAALTIEVIFLIIWSVVDPPKVHPNKMVDYTIQDQCKSDTNIFWIIFISMKGAWLMFGVIISVLTRNILKEYSNFNQTVYAIYNMLILIVIAIPLAVLLNDVPDGVTIIALIVVVLAFMFTTIILFFETWFSVLSPDSNKIPAMTNMTKRAGNDTSSTKGGASGSSKSSSSA